MLPQAAPNHLLTYMVNFPFAIFKHDLASIALDMIMKLPNFKNIPEDILLSDKDLLLVKKQLFTKPTDTAVEVFFTRICPPHIWDEFT